MMTLRNQALLMETANASEINPAEPFVCALFYFTLSLQLFQCGRMNCSFLEVLAQSLLSHVLVRPSLQWAHVWAWMEHTSCVGACMCLCMKIKILWLVPDLGGARCHVMSCSTRVEEKGGVWLMTIFFFVFFCTLLLLLGHMELVNVHRANSECNTANNSASVWMFLDWS